MGEHLSDEAGVPHNQLPIFDALLGQPMYGHRRDFSLGGCASHADEFRTDAHLLVIGGWVIRVVHEYRAAELPAGYGGVIVVRNVVIGRRSRKFGAQGELLTVPLKGEEAIDELIARL